MFDLTVHINHSSEYLNSEYLVHLVRYDNLMRCTYFKITQGGAFHYLEEFVGRALQRSLCLLHHVELVLRAIFEMYDGKPLGEKIEISFTKTVGYG